MTQRAASRKLMILDACVLIDFIKADRSVLRLIANHVGQIHVASPVVDEINEVDGESELEELGLIIIEPEIEDAYAAAAESGSTSFQDRLCMYVSKRLGFTCVTNDKNLRSLCEKENVPLLWGLQLIIELHKSGGIPMEDALDIGQRIHETNPKHITQTIVNRFKTIVKKHQVKL